MLLLYISERTSIKLLVKPLFNNMFLKNKWFRFICLLISILRSTSKHFFFILFTRIKSETLLVVCMRWSLTHFWVRAFNTHFQQFVHFYSVLVIFFAIFFWFSIQSVGELFFVSVFSFLYQLNILNMFNKLYTHVC